MKCKNCGHDSHCGNPLFREERDFIDVPPYQIEVCKHCRCDKCTPPDWG